jgi:hypothetical protein
MTPAALSAIASGDLENFIIASTPGGIEAQEKRGQHEADLLPCWLRGMKIDRESLRSGLLHLGERVTGADIFQPVVFPTGWKKVPTDHSMWTDIVDDKGRKRGGIFYKAAFYDRSAHAYLSSRFRVSLDFELEGETETVMIKDVCGLIDRKITGITKPNWSDREKAFEAMRKRDVAEAELKSWLDIEYPEWKDPASYWS